ncbi:hypothetical protein KHS38_10100 [Mucilaginibacter sp. Bleaf8]|uniref:hypothetical protein n=1 Tax=Mucilaginibacter sp. Bleaf8 TaxID=2834430 RepID=UPI001BCE2BF2|nr:hypothetical protein [Mucilaginibacter sp. Bleaf8]MBS7564756.1 hypothetical protein [Mucilaginibacter sp. Bleaf8]
MKMLFIGFANPESLLAMAGIVAILLSFFLLGKWTLLLRDDVSGDPKIINAANISLIKIKTNITSPYSLSKVQLGLWTVVISCSYLYLSLFEGDCSEAKINQTALVVLGIFSGTAAITKIIDKREIGDDRPRHQNSPSGGFFYDILSDDSGISIHRFQHVIWTIVGMAVYLYKVAQITKGCILPELSDTLLTLMGISSATFVTMRSQENDEKNQQPVVNTVTNYKSHQPADGNNSIPEVNSTIKPVPDAKASPTDNTSTGADLQAGGNSPIKDYKQMKINSVAKTQETSTNVPVPDNLKAQTDYSSKANFGGSSDFYG